MLVAIALVAFAPVNGVVAIEGLAVGQFAKGKWRTCDLGKNDPVGMASTKLAFTLGINGTITPITNSLKFLEEEPEGLQSWYTEPMQETMATWFGPKLPITSILQPAPASLTYLGVLADYLKKKGMKGAKARLDKVVLTDLDGDGTREAVLFGMSQAEPEMWSTLSLDGKTSHPQDYACVLVRYVSGKSTAIKELLWTDGRKGSLDGFWQYAGIWNLDGVKGAEILVASRYYEGRGGLIFQFNKGKAKKLVEHVVGV